MIYYFLNGTHPHTAEQQDKNTPTAVPISQNHDEYKGSGLTQPVHRGQA